MKLGIEVVTVWSKEISIGTALGRHRVKIGHGRQQLHPELFRPAHLYLFSRSVNHVLPQLGRQLDQLLLVLATQLHQVGLGIRGEAGAHQRPGCLAGRRLVHHVRKLGGTVSLSLVYDFGAFWSTRRFLGSRYLYILSEILLNRHLGRIVGREEEDECAGETVPQQHQRRPNVPPPAVRAGVTRVLGGGVAGGRADVVPAQLHRHHLPLADHGAETSISTQITIDITALYYYHDSLFTNVYFTSQ